MMEKYGNKTCESGRYLEKRARTTGNCRDRVGWRPFS